MERLFTLLFVIADHTAHTGHSVPAPIVDDGTVLSPKRIEGVDGEYALALHGPSPLARNEHGLGHLSGLIGKGDDVGAVGAGAAHNLDGEALGILAHRVGGGPSHLQFLEGHADYGSLGVDVRVGRCTEQFVDFAEVLVSLGAIVVEVHPCGQARSSHLHAAGFFLVVGLDEDDGIVDM